MAYIAASVRLFQSFRYIICSAPLVKASAKDEREKIKNRNLQLRLVLIGQVNTGKCSTANSLANVIVQKNGAPSPVEQRYDDLFKIFEIGNFGKNVAKRRQCQSISIRGGAKFGLKEVSMVVTPALQQTMSDDFIVSEFSNCVVSSAPGPHAFLIFVRVGYSNPKEVAEQVNSMKEVFGKEFINHTVFVFTGVDSTKEQGSNVEKFVNSNGDFKELIKECKGRYVTFDNDRLWGSNKKPTTQDRAHNIKQSTNLLEVVMNMMDENQDGYYSDKFYQRARSIYRHTGYKSGCEFDRMERLMHSEEMEGLREKIQKLRKSNASCIIL